MLSIYIATSLNGMIARPDGALEWLFDPAEGEDYGYAEYMKDVKGLVMGGETYRICRKLGPWYYGTTPTLVITHTEQQQADTPEGVRFVRTDPVEAVKAFHAEVGDKIWLVGGGQINTILWNAGLVTELINSVHPIWLKEGIPMLTPEMEERPMTLQSCKAYKDGLVQMTYRMNPDGQD